MSHWWHEPSVGGSVRTLTPLQEMQQPERVWISLAQARGDERQARCFLLFVFRGTQYEV